MVRIEYCSQCGIRLPQYARFCPCCGKVVVEIPDEEPPYNIDDDVAHGRYVALTKPAVDKLPAVSRCKVYTSKFWIPVISLVVIFLLPVVLALTFHMSGTKLLASDIEPSRKKASQASSAKYIGEDRPLGCGLTLIKDSIELRKEKNNDIVFYLEGEIRNDSGEKYSSIFLFFDLYDSAGKRLDTVMATLKLDNGETGKFSVHVFVPYDQVESYVIDNIVAV